MGLTQEIGRGGEQAAVEWLRNEGFQIVACNWRKGSYEIDIVARRWDTLHFVEVKTRDAFSWERPEEAMTAAKRRSFLKAVKAYIALYDPDLNIQLDLMAVDVRPEGIREVRYIPEAMIARW